MKIHRLIVLAFCMALTASVAGAADYYVAQKDAAADDGNSGTALKPFKTISGSLPHLKPGDTVYVRAGVYREQVMLPKEDWTLDKHTWKAFPCPKSITEPIRFFAQSGEDSSGPGVVIKGSDVVNGWKKTDDPKRPIWVKDDWAINSQQVFCEGQCLQQIAGQFIDMLMEVWKGQKGKGLADLEAGSFFCDTKAKKLYVWLKDGGDPNQHVMEVSVRPFLFTTNVDYIQISGFKMMHSNTSALVNWPAVHLNGSYGILDNCEVTWCDFNGLSIAGHSNTVSRCRVNHCGDTGITGGGWGNQVLDTQVAYNNYRLFNSGWGAGGMKIIPMAHSWLISGCVAEYNIASDGIWFDAYNSNVTIQNCIMRYNQGNGIHYEISERAIIRNNVAYENIGRGIYLSNSSNSIVLHNVCYRNGMSGIVVHGVNRPGGFSSDPETGYEPARNNVVWGNIMVDNCNPDLCPKDVDHTGKTWSQRPELILPDPKISSDRGCLSDYNIFYRSDNRAICFWENFGSGIYGDLAEWQTKTGNDRHSRVVKPLFVDAAKFDFHPAKDSPAIQFVRPSVAIQFDADNKERPVWVQSFTTAGPFEPPKEWLKLPAPPKDAGPQMVPLQNAPLPADDKTLAPLAEALQGLKLESLGDKQTGLKLQGVPFLLDSPLKAIVLNKQHPRVLIPVNKIAKSVVLLQAIISPGKGEQSRCVILRQDGMVIPLRWVAGENIGPSVGDFNGKLVEEQGESVGGYQLKLSRKPSQTQVAWEGKAGQTPVRLFATTWQNENEWLPVREMEWTLKDESATIVIFAVTVK